LQRRFLAHLSASFNGVWLGLMDREALDLIDETYYENKPHYVDEAYNTSGLRDWEARMIDEHFPRSGRVVVTATGGGREVVALLDRGYDVVGYEPNIELLDAAAKMLERRGQRARVHAVERDVFPPDAGPCDAVIVGWGSYMLIPGRDQRIEFLRGARSVLPADGPILLSFFTRSPQARTFTTTARVANVMRLLRRLPRVDVGDALGPNYTHYFTRAEIDSELDAAGFRLVAYDEEPYGHAVGRAAG
jgi:hypothetical protein